MSDHMTDSELSPRGQRLRSDASSSMSTLDEMAAQIHSIDAAAQRASRRLQQNAADLRTAERRQSGGEEIAALADTLVARADGIRADCEGLSALLDRATRLLRSPDAEVATPLQAVPPASAWQGPGTNGSRLGQPALSGVRLAATQLAIAGSTRTEVQQGLGDQFALRDLEPVLDEIFGQAQAGAG